MTEFVVQEFFNKESFVDSGMQRALIHALTAEGLDPSQVSWQHPITLVPEDQHIHYFKLELHPENHGVIIDIVTDELKGEWVSERLDFDFFEDFPEICC